RPQQSFRDNPNIPETQDEVQKLIAEYRKFESLYDPSNPQYGRRGADKIYYSEIAQHFPGTTTREIQEYIAELRMLFEREYWHIESTYRRTGELLEPSIRYYNDFLFLAPYMDNSESLVSEPAYGLSRRSAFAPEEVRPNNQVCSSLQGGQSMRGSFAPGENLSARHISDCREDGYEKYFLRTTGPSFICKRRKKAAEAKDKDNNSGTGTNSKTDQTGAAGKNGQANGESQGGPERRESQQKVRYADCGCQLNSEVTLHTPTRQSMDMDGRYEDSGMRYSQDEQREVICTSPNCPSRAGNSQQVQLLCDLIKMELGSAPEQVYDEAKWRIIEILRDVQRRGMCPPPGSKKSSYGRGKKCQCTAKLCPQRPNARTVLRQLRSKMQALLHSSKLLRHWPSIVLGFLLALIVKFIANYRRKQRGKPLAGEEDIAVDFPHSTAAALQPALAPKPHIPFVPGESLNPAGAKRFYHLMRGRRSVRSFAASRVPALEVIEDCIRAAGTAPSGAHTEPWTFCVVQKSALKQAVRELVEHEEQINYSTRMHAQWVTDLRPLQTTAVKPYLTEAPYLILIFKQTHGTTADGRRKLHYYNEISTSIATGVLLCALQAAGLCSLVSTPLNCGPALRRLLKRPTSEKLLILLAVGYAAEDCRVPDLERKCLQDIMVKY
ncbi:hypothetical protein KR222_000148, partial [Zaprionus bogoriensis]